MKSISVASLVKGLASLLFLSALGQSFAYTLNDALGNARSRPAVAAAAQELTVAEEELERTNADPFALKLEKTQAQQRLALSKIRVDETYYAAVSEIGGAYAAQLQAVLEQQAALANEALSRRQAAVARIRLRRGSATEVEVREAEAALEVATAGRQGADEALTFARNALGALLPIGGDLIGQLEPIPNAATEHPLPDIDAVLRATAKTSALLSLQQAVSLARLNLTLLDPSYSSVREIETGETTLETATATFLETTRTLFAEVRTLYAQTSAAQELFQAQRATATAAQARLQLQRQRFSRGLIADLELRQAEFDTMTAQLEMMRAKHVYVSSLLQLQAVSATPLGSFGADTQGENPANSRAQADRLQAIPNPQNPLQKPTQESSE